MEIWTLIGKKVLAIIIGYPIIQVLALVSIFIRHGLGNSSTTESEKLLKRLIIISFPMCIIGTVIAVILWVD